MKNCFFVPALVLFMVFYQTVLAEINSPYHPHRIAIICQQTFRDIRTIGEPDHLFQTLGYKTLSLYARMHGYDFITLPYKPIFKDTIGMASNREPGWVKVYWTRTQFGSVINGPRKQLPNEDVKATCKKYDWVIWMDSDIFITNYTISIEEIIEKSKGYSHDKNYPHFIASAHGHFDNNGITFNTGVAFVRCSDEALQLLNYILTIREEKNQQHYVSVWDMQGPLITARHIDETSRKAITLIPSKLINASPYPHMTPTKDLIDCPKNECPKGWWEPGDFLVHFPGVVKEFPGPFLKKYPPTTWVGWSETLEPLREGRRRGAI
mmetsp:Transcript_2024/g.3010  ORF Transcript_2024/g.3010 Transcript_2024/m.3010 type:complete len:322 (-) Transcript_2024:649-1614(-)|eukprot:CAMPEP_0175076808 /NCGR_PEP_ID=MMETSP0052_2-20121109/22976_1 /TAXON_ID=51329 ORGANISM="Polytomella parva, Strain SAG 63-3" /NCGR_SAMPLE_ID=MMETSP0052_2 /ASSEMBLY_ACC=CAM_ASM_000194 /LENGTH=321 /DNA_ID=CAMNT_0016346075 /DNA_START=80 /DNA_END=1045 /DNA_ORIENTATION=-